MKIASRPGRLLVSLLLLVLSFTASAAERTVYFVNDAQGSPVAAMDQQGEVVWRESYAPYGERRTKAADNNGKPAYTGKPEDTDTSLVYMHARMYDPETARFTGIDPQGFKEANAQSFGRYLYANNSPYKYTDPDGELPTPLDGLLLAYDAGAWALAMHSGNPIAIAEASADLGASFMGVWTPIPGGGLAIKAARAAEKASGDGRVAYRAINPKYADATAENGFHVSGAAGRLGNDGVYANSTVDGAVAEFKHHSPDIEPAVFEVNFSSSNSLKIDPPSGYFDSPLPFTGGANVLEAPSLRASGTTNFLIREGASPGARIQ